MTKRQMILIKGYLMSFNGSFLAETGFLCDICGDNATKPKQLGRLIKGWTRDKQQPYLCEAHAREAGVLW
jgi:hypothetical protein